MHRCKTLLSAGSMLVLIGAAAPGAAEAEIVVEARVQSQTAARTGVRETAGQARRPDVLSRRVTLDLVDAPLGSALEAIARLADFALAYNPSILPAARTVTVSAADLPVRDALARVLEGTGLEPVMTRTGQLTLVRRPDPPARARGSAPAAAQQAVVTGVVTDEATGEVLRGAQVRVEEPELSAVTDAEGRYTLEDVPPGTHTLVARIIGYREARQEVTVAAGATASVDFTLAVSALPLDEVVVTGTMVPTRMRAVPSPVSVITAEDIERRGIVRFEDVLRSIPGVAVVSRNGQEFWSQLYVRGANSLDVQRSGIKTYIDGVEVANVQYSLNQIDPASIERIELIRGPQASTLHGSEAIAGVLQIFTKTGQIGEPARLQGTVAAGTLESQYTDGLTLVQSHSATISGGEDSFSYRLGASYGHTGEWVEDEMLDELGWDVRNSASDDIGLSGGIHYSSGSVTAKASARVHRKMRGAPLSKALVEPARNGTWNYPTLARPSATEHDLDLQTYGITLAYEVNRNWHHRLALGRDGTLMEIMTPYPRGVTPADTFHIYQALHWDRLSLSYNTALDLSFGRHISATLQAGFDRSALSQRIAFTSDARQLEGGLGNERANLTRGTLSNHGFHIQTQVALHDQLFITTGLRGDGSTGFGEDAGYAWSPRFGISHVLNVGSFALKARASFGRAIRPPEPQQTGGQTLGASVFLANENLAPETQSGYDIGLDLHTGPHFSAGVTRYDQRASNLIGLVSMSEPSDVPQIRQYQNVGRIRNTGWEFEGSIHLPSLSVTGHYGLMDSVVERLAPGYTGVDFVAGRRPLNAPRSIGALSTTFTTSRLDVTFGMTYKGSWQAYEYLPYFDAIFGTSPDREPYKGNLRDYIDDYSAVFRYEVNATYDVSSHLSASVMIDNVFDDDRPDQWDYHLVRGRQILLGVGFDFGQ